MNKNVRVNRNYLTVKDELDQKEKELDGKDNAFSVSLLSHPSLSSSSRSLMSGSHIKQHMVLKNTDIPRMLTNYEYIFGKHSTGYKKTKSEYEIIAKISKYSWMSDHIYTLIVYNKNTDKYEIIEKKNIEDLTENFCYTYNTDVIDSYMVGDTIPKDTVLWRTTSYDEDMNYGFGRNVNVVYTADPYSTEDAIIASESASKMFTSTESTTIKIPVNDNDILCNIYGDSNTFKVLPDIGESTKGNILCSKRRMITLQQLYDFNDRNIRKINFNSDTPYFANGIIEDIDVYCNKELDELPQTPYNIQLIKYVKEQKRYWSEIVDVTRKLIENVPEKVTKDINYAFKRGSMIISPEYKWKMEDQIFSNMIISVTIRKDVGLSKGSKLTGRCGNKGVVSLIVPDKNMYYVEKPDGTKVYADVALNCLGVINRTNNSQLVEQEANRCGDRLCDYIHFTAKTLKEKEDAFFTFYRIMNVEQMKSLRKYYDSLESNERKEKFFTNLYKEKTYLHVPPFFQIEGKSMFDKFIELYKALPWISDVDTLYINRFGRKIPVMRETVMGSEYFMKLKQNSKKAFSVCSLSSINEQNLPIKSKRAKEGLELYPKATIRFGIQETTNFLIGVEPEFLAKLAEYYRSCPIGRRLLAKKSMSTKELEDFPEPEEKMMNVNVEILNSCYLKCQGYALKFTTTDDVHVYDFSDTGLYSHTDENTGEVFIGTNFEYEKHKIEKKVKEYFSTEEFYVLEEQDVAKYNKMISDKVDEEIEKKFQLDINKFRD